MSEQAVLWLFGVLITALFALIATLGRMFWARLEIVDSGALAAFVAKDTEREKAWWTWRDVIDARLNDKRAQLKDHEHRITRLERNGY